MQDPNYQFREAEQARGTTDQPAIGIVATPDNTDAVLRSILRARAEGYEPLVTAVDESVEAYRLATELDVYAVDPLDRSRGGEDHWERVAYAARTIGFPAVIAHRDPSHRIDYDRSGRAALAADDYLVQAAPVSPLETEPHVLAAIPAYNEAASIEEVIVETSGYADEVLVVDDGSADETAAVARAAGATVLEHERNRGYGGSLKTIFRAADRSHADHLVILDGDGQHDASDIPALVECQRESDAPVVIGSRFADGAGGTVPLYRRFGLFVVNLMTNLSLGIVRPRSWVGDTQSGFRAYDRQAIESLAADETIGDEMGASTDILYHATAADFAIEEVGTTIDYDVDNASSHNPVSHGIHLVMNILRTIERERPISSLGLPGTLSALVGIGFAYLTMANYVDSGTFPLGFALLSVSFALLGTFACFTAIVLHSLNTHLEV